jgi:hypothetical protein
MQTTHLPGGRPSEPRMGTTPNVAPAGSADPPFLIQLLSDEPGLRFLAAQLLYVSEPLLSAWVGEGVLTRWLALLDDEHEGTGTGPSPSHSVGSTS